MQLLNGVFGFVWMRDRIWGNRRLDPRALDLRAPNRRRLVSRSRDVAQAAARKVVLPRPAFGIRAYGRRVAQDAVSALGAAPMLLLLSAAYVTVACAATVATVTLTVEFFDLDRWMGLVLHGAGTSR